jgi:hypothetical protein
MDRMLMRRILAAGLGLLVAVGAAPLVAQQAAVGTINGRATDEARKPYTDYTVQLRDAETGQIAGTVPLDAQGGFAFANLDVSRRFLVELYSLKEREILCTEGPYPLAPEANRRRNVNIDCGAAPAAIWLLAAGAGAVAAIGVVTVSASQ